MLANGPQLVRQSMLPHTNYIRLPICDILFCTFSLSLHIVAFTSVLYAAYRLKYSDYFLSFCILISLASLGSLTVSITSFIWYIRNGNEAFRRVDLGLHVTVHILQLTTLWRHHLFFRQIPHNVVKFLFCELLSLRILHSAIFALPSSLFLFFTLFTNGQDIGEIQTPILTAAILCLTDLSFSLASFNRHTNRNRPELLILSWPSILCQFVWRYGCVGGRLVILAAYSSGFQYLTGIVVGLHWLLMFLGLFMFTRPKREANEERTQSCRWTGHCFVLAIVHIFCFYNPAKEGVKWRCTAFYIVMFLENSLLLVLWILLAKPTAWWIRPFVLGMGWGGSIFGIAIMLIYYKFLHVTKLKAAFDGNTSPRDQIGRNTPSRNGTFVCKLSALPTSFRTAAKHEVVTIAKKYQRPPEEDQQQESVAKSGQWTRNDRRCRSVPSQRRRSSYGEVPSSVVFAESEIRTAKTECQTEVVIARVKGHSIPRRIKNGQRFPELETSLPDDSPNGQDTPRTRDNTVPRSTFIETIF